MAAETRINTTSSRRIGPTIPNHINTTDSISLIRQVVRALYKEESYALFLIAYCSWYLGKSCMLAYESDSQHETI
jgi:hypothetical protein